MSPRQARSGGPQRADATRNRAAIIDATIAELRRDPDASVGQIATAAGVGRVTLYGHFGGRTELIDAALVEVLARGDRALDGVDLTGDPTEALVRLIDSSWKLLDESRALLRAAQRELPAERIREAHLSAERRVRRLVERGRREGAFRTDLPTSWLLATMHVVMHTAADEIAAGRLSVDDAPRAIRETVLGAFRPPAAPA